MASFCFRIIPKLSSEYAYKGKGAVCGEESETSGQTEVNANSSSTSSANGNTPHLAHGLHVLVLPLELLKVST